MMYFKWQVRLALVAAVGTVGITACVAPKLPDIPSHLERITYRPQSPPFCGRCETVDLTFAADGRLWIETGYWAGNYRTWRRYRRLVLMRPEQFLEFKARLAPYKPDRDVMNDCKDYLTDNDGAVVEWITGEDTRVRVFDFGCRDDKAMVEAVRSAPKVLLTQAQKDR